MEKLVIDHLVEKNREGSYYTLPFSVPEGVRSLTVRYSYPKQGNVIDLGLEDGQGQFLGWSGSCDRRGVRCHPGIPDGADCFRNLVHSDWRVPC